MNSITNGVVVFSVSSATVLKDVLEADGTKMARSALNKLIAGEVAEVKGWSLCDDVVAAPVAPVVDAPAPAPVVDAPAPAPRVSGDANFDEAALAAAVADAAANPPAPVEPAAPAAPAPVRVHAPRAKAVVKNAAPRGKIKPVRAGTKIADGLVMMIGGTTEAEILGANLTDDAVDFVNRRVTKRGYGVKLDGGKIFLVFPEGVTAVVMTGATVKAEA